MVNHFNLKGKCLCGSVQVNVNCTNNEVTACHCDMCRRWSAGPFLEVTCENVLLDGAENITRFNSSEWAERGFCSQCGSCIFYHIIGTSEYQFSTGLFDDQSRFEMTMQVFIDDKPNYYNFSNTTQTMTSEEVYKAYGATQD